MQIKPQIISGFPGIGKSYATHHHQNVIDLESTTYHWIIENSLDTELQKGNANNRTFNPEFPLNYIKKIQELAKENTVLISAHPIVLNEMAKQNIPFITVSPDATQRDDYTQRYLNRGNSHEFTEHLRSSFFEHVQELNSHPGASQHVLLKPGQYLNDILTD